MLTVTDVSTTCAVVIFRVKISCITSVDDFTLVIDLIGQFRRGALGFSVLRFCLFFRSVFRFLLQKTSVFRFWWSLRFADFSFFSIWFSVFVNNTSGFWVLVPDVVFGFSYFVLFWVPVSVRFEQHLISNSRETPKLWYVW